MQTAFNGRSVAAQHQADSYFTPLMYNVLSPAFDGVRMLYIGLSDVKGQSIYEADIVTLWDRETNTAVTGIVTWNQARAAFVIHVPGARSRDFSGGGEEGNCETCEVIGNTFEHPDRVPRA